MDFFHSWPVFLPKFLDKSSYDKKETKKYKFGIVNSFYKWKSSHFRLTYVGEKRLCFKLPIAETERCWSTEDLA